MVSTSSITSETSFDKELDFGITSSITLQVERMLQVYCRPSPSASLPDQAVLLMLGRDQNPAAHVLEQRVFLPNKSAYIIVLHCSKTCVSVWGC